MEIMASFKFPGIDDYIGLALPSSVWWICHGSLLQMAWCRLAYNRNQPESVVL
jgi:hypothetical protein